MIRRSAPDDLPDLAPAPEDWVDPTGEGRWGRHGDVLCVADDGNGVLCQRRNGHDGDHFVYATTVDGVDLGDYFQDLH